MIAISAAHEKSVTMGKYTRTHARWLCCMTEVRMAKGMLLKCILDFERLHFLLPTVTSEDAKFPIEYRRWLSRAMRPWKFHGRLINRCNVHGVLAKECQARAARAAMFYKRMDTNIQAFRLAHHGVHSSKYPKAPRSFVRC